MNSPNLLTRRKGEAVFEGKKALISPFPIEDFKKETLHIGELEELECETPLENKVNIFGLIKSKKKPIVSATSNGKMVVVMSSDTAETVTDDTSVLTHDTQTSLQDAKNLYTAFHGTEFDKISKINISDPDYLVFFGHLNFIVYSVPQTSERRGVPFIHEAKDRGDDVPPSRNKPIIVISPKKDYLVMYGSQFEFTERGIIG